MVGARSGRVAVKLVNSRLGANAYAIQTYRHRLFFKVEETAGELEQAISCPALKYQVQDD